MDLTQAFQQSRYVETTINGTNIIIERFNGPDDISQCWQYDVHPVDHERYHGTQYGTLTEDVLADIYENDNYVLIEDGQLEQADWQSSAKTIDVSDCTCMGCYWFCLDYHILPRGIAWHRAAWYQAKWAVVAMLWRVRMRWMLLQEKFNLYWR